MPCSNECMKGCRGGEVYDCNDCRTLKLKLPDLTYTLARTAESCGILKTKSSYNNIFNNNQIDFANQLLKHCSKDLNNENLYKLVESYRDFYIIREFNMSGRVLSKEENEIFCVSGCPKHVPYQTTNWFCSREK